MFDIIAISTAFKCFLLFGVRARNVANGKHLRICTQAILYHYKVCIAMYRISK